MLSAGQLPPRERAELVMKAPAWTWEPNDREWYFLHCPRCKCDALVRADWFKSKSKGRLMLPCIYCGAYSRKPGVTLIKATKFFKEER